LTGTADGTAQLWDVGTGKKVGPALRHRGRISCAVFSADGRRFATGSSSQMARLWKTPVPIRGDPRRTLLWTEAVTGMELDPNDGPSVLSAETWQERRRELETMDGSR
jgi:WD40 repeat protein